MTSTTLLRTPGRIGLLATLAALVAAAVAFAPAARSAAAVVVPAPAVDLPVAPGLQTAVLAGGCFWGVQAVFQHVAGVRSAVSGYAGGTAETARYDRVGSGRTQHAESVQIVYDPQVVSYGRLLQIYFSVAHDPTELNRQGPDRGPQYRSTVFAADAGQARVARAYIEQLDLARTFGKALATTVEPLPAFYPAEAYHQDFLVRHPAHPYIVVNDLPKVEQLQRLFPERYRATPVLVGGAG